MDIYEEVQMLRQQVQELQVAISNMASRGTLRSSEDLSGIQKQSISALYGEELADIQLWQPFGLSGQCPPGGDVLLLSMGGARDGAQALAVTHPQFRPRGQNIGETTIYDAGGQTISLSVNGITISDQFGSVIKMSDGAIEFTCADFKVASATLTHNGIDISDDHTHSGISPGPGRTGSPK